MYSVVGMAIRPQTSSFGLLRRVQTESAPVAALLRLTMAQGEEGGCQQLAQSGRALSFCLATDQRVGLFESRARVACEVEARTAGRQVKGCDPGEM